MAVKLSVCIPIYKVENYIERCAISLFTQTIKEGIEFIFVNDCTPDLSIKRLKDVLSKFPDRISQVKIINHEENKGVATARQTAVDHAKGEYITHCDGDDWIEPNMYATLLKKACETDADVVSCDFFLEETNGYKEIKFHYSEKEYFLRDVIGNKWGTIWKYIVKRTVLEEGCISFHPDINNGEDYIYTSKVLLYTTKYAHINECFYQYNCSNQFSMMHSIGINSAEQQKLASDIVFSLLDEKGLTQEFSEEILIRKVFTRIQYLVAGGKWKEIYPEVTRQLYNSKRLSWPKKIILIGLDYLPTFLLNTMVKYIAKRK